MRSRNQRTRSSAGIVLVIAMVALLFTSVFTNPIKTLADEDIRITVNPQNRVWPEDSVAVYHVEAEGKNIVYEWHLVKDGTDHAWSDYVSGKASLGWTAENIGVLGTEPNTFSIVGIPGAAAGMEIYCEVTNDTISTRTESAIIQVTDSTEGGTTAMPPEITVPAEVDVETGYNGGLLKLACQAEADSASDLIYQWYETSTGELLDIMALDGEEYPILVLSTSEPGIHFYVCMVKTVEGGVAYSSVIPVKVGVDESGDEEEVVGISIITDPVKLLYKVGEKPDLAGLEVRLTTTMGFIDTDNVDLFRAEPEVIDKNTVSITIFYGDLFDVFPIDVELPEPTEEPTTAPTTEPTAAPTAEVTAAPEATPTTEPETSDGTAASGTEITTAPTTAEGSNSSNASSSQSQSGTEEKGSVALPTWALILIICLAVVVGILGGAVIAMRKKK